MEPTNTITTGREPYSDEQYTKWLDDMSPFLKFGDTLYHAIEKAGLIKHKDTIYRKVRLNDWFCEKITILRSYPAELVNNIFMKLITTIDANLTGGLAISGEEWRNLRFFAERHKSCKTYFFDKSEIAQRGQDDIEELLSQLDEQNKSDRLGIIEKTNYNDVAYWAKMELEKLDKPKSETVNLMPIDSR